MCKFGSLERQQKRADSLAACVGVVQASVGNVSEALTSVVVVVERRKKTKMTKMRTSWTEECRYR